MSRPHSYGASVHLNHVIYSARTAHRRGGKSVSHAGQRWNVPSWVACLLSRDAVLRPAVWDGRWWSDPCKRVDVQWEHAARIAQSLGKRDAAALIHVACAGSPESSISMLLEVAARSSPAVMDGEQPSRSSWCGFISQITAAGPKRRMLLAKKAA
ncbi:hypothetical protein TcBrA4_0111190 [Trypanosoma cruzi]|nr:hypothetical protein TcBrA4_0111190 [Trypanosoma cruzi]